MKMSNSEIYDSDNEKQEFCSHSVISWVVVSFLSESEKFNGEAPSKQHTSATLGYQAMYCMTLIVELHR